MPSSWTRVCGAGDVGAGGEWPLWGGAVPPYLFAPCLQELVLLAVPQVVLLAVAAGKAGLALARPAMRRPPVPMRDAVLLGARMVAALVALAAVAVFWSAADALPPYAAVGAALSIAMHAAAVVRQPLAFPWQYQGDALLIATWAIEAVVASLRLRTRLIVVGGGIGEGASAYLLVDAIACAVAFALELVGKDWRVWVVRLQNLDGRLCPEAFANLLSLISFSWADRLMVLGYKRDLQQADLWRLPAFLRPRTVQRTFEPYWREERARPAGERSLLRAILRRHLWGVIATGLIKLTQDLLLFVQPLLLQLLITFVTEASSKEPGETVYIEFGLLLAVGMLLTATLQTTLLQQYYHGTIRMSNEVRIEIVGKLYEKALRQSNHSRQAMSVGDIVTRMSIDAQRIMDMIPYLHLVWSGPFQIVVSIVLLYFVLGPAIFAGLGVIVLLVPLNLWVAWRMSVLQEAQMKNKDARIKIMDEVLGAMKIIKLYSWEKAFLERIMGIRNKELATLTVIAKLEAVQNFSWTGTPILMSLASFATYTLTGNTLTSDTAFVALSLFNILQFPMVVFPMIISGVVELRVSMRRLNEFFDAEELDELQYARVSTLPPDAEINRQDLREYVQLPGKSAEEEMYASLDGYTPLGTGDEAASAVASKPAAVPLGAVQIERGTFAWGDAESTPQLSEVDVAIEPGKLVAVVGMVGAGKSSLLAAVLGEMRRVSGTVQVNGSIAYVPQQAWIRNETLQANIRFGHEGEGEGEGEGEDDTRYQAAIDACALRPDLAVLPEGDRTEIGEKGINLSGGQKARVSLARAVYSDADIVLLDDPLGAVDAHVAAHLFERVIGPGGLLRQKTRVFVTHSVQFLSRVDHVVVMKDGRVAEQGSYAALMALSPSFSRLLTEFAGMGKEVSRRNSDNAEGEVASGTVDQSHSLNVDEPEAAASAPVESKKATLIEKEEMALGAVQASVYFSYIKSIGRSPVALLLFMFTLAQATQVGNSLWLSYWSAQNDNDKIGLYIGIYALTGISSAVLSVGVYLYGYVVCGIRAARVLHVDLLKNVLRAPLSFFDTTPIGRIVNRFSKDQYTVDEVLPGAFLSYINQVYTVLGILLIISLSTPAFAIAIVPLGILYWFIQRFYIATSRQLKRLDSVTRSPIFAHFSEALQGVATIRAYGQEERFMAENYAKLDENVRANYAAVAANRWLAMRLEMLGAVIVFLSALFSVLGYATISPSLVGLSVTYALSITAELNWMVRMSSDVETHIVSVERIHEYAYNLQTEAPDVVPDRTPLASWPARGEVAFDNYSTRYREGLSLVLKNISFRVRPSEKIGIVGTTGAGKSSLTQALFRLIEPVTGAIVVDDLDTTQIGLHDLRSRLTIIPQDCVLFSGTLRYNLDPFDERSDEAVWAALECTAMKSVVTALPDQLAHVVSPGGDNFSLGQRQLLCMARALLRRSKVLVLDEATASVDLETDAIIQRTIRREFADCTILTIAHRLHTVMDSDRILVLAHGEVAELDTPAALLANPASAFHALARQARLV